MTDSDNFTNFVWGHNTWDVAKTYFSNRDALVKHHLDSFNDYINNILPTILLKQGFPLKVEYANRHASFDITNVYISLPLTNGRDSTRQLLPKEARIRGLSYTAGILIDTEFRYTPEGSEGGTGGGGEQVVKERKVPITGHPVMVGSKCCHTFNRSVQERVAMGECEMDRGGYFIVNGNEKVVICQERPLENIVLTFPGLPDKRSLAYAVVRSTPDPRYYPVRVTSLYLDKPGNKDPPGNKLKISIPRIRHNTDIPVVVFFRALGIVTDREILETIFGDLKRADEAELAQVLPSLKEAPEVKTQLEAIEFISKLLSYSPPTDLEPQDREIDRLNFAKDTVNRYTLYHLGMDNRTKATMTGIMVRKLVRAYLDPSQHSDRDHYLNKRVDSVGALLAQITRSNVQKMQVDLKKAMVRFLKDTTAGTLNVRKIIQKCNIESRLKYALATGNWHTSKSHANAASKKGIAQVLQRLSTLGTLSHLRRLNSPLASSGGQHHEPPRRYGLSQLGKVCPNETPEGEQVGIVKNMALLSYITIFSNPLPVIKSLMRLGVQQVDIHNYRRNAQMITVYVNGYIVGVVENGEQATELVDKIRILRRHGVINPYNSVSWNTDKQEINLYTDGGRYCRPLYIVNRETGRLLIEERWNEPTIRDAIKNRDWDTLITGSKEIEENPTLHNGGVIEYLDTNEDSTSLICFTPDKLISSRLVTIRDKIIEPLPFHIKESPYDIDSVQREDTFIFTVPNLPLSERSREQLGGQLKDAIEELLPAWAKSAFRNSVRELKVQRELANLNRGAKTGLVRAEIVLGENADQRVIRNLNRLINRDYCLYTHCDIHPCFIHGVVAQMIPFSDHNQSPRNVYQSAMGKQALGVYATNYAERMDTSNILCNPQRPLVETRTSELLGLDRVPYGQQAVVAVACFTGYNQEDSVIMNRSALERGMFNSSFNRIYYSKLASHKAGLGTREVFGIPPPETVSRKVGGIERYHAINRENGFPRAGTYVEGGDIVISKYNINVGDNQQSYRDSSTVVNHTEDGVVDWVIPNSDDSIPNRNAEGYEFCKARVSQFRIPVIGDKFASRAAQKGTVGMVYPQEDMPFTAQGVVPDIIMNPHALPSRMTVGQMIEALLSKTASLEGEVRDGTPFTEYSEEEAKRELAKYGFDYNGHEIMYNGSTGEMFEVAIFINPTYYQRLKHMVSDKIHARNGGPVQVMTRQPAEGRSRNGGLRVGEMERDAFVAHGMPVFWKEKTMESSDGFKIYVSREVGDMIIANAKNNIVKRGEENIYGEEDIVCLEVPWSEKLFIQELTCMGIRIKFSVD